MFQEANDAQHRAVVEFCVAARRDNAIRREFAAGKRAANRVLREERGELLRAMVAREVTAVALGAERRARLAPRVTGRLRMTSAAAVVECLAAAAARHGLHPAIDAAPSAEALLEQAYRASGTSKMTLSIGRAVRGGDGTEAEALDPRTRALVARVAEAGARVEALRDEERTRRREYRETQRRLHDEVAEHMARHDPTNDAQKIMMSDGARAQTYYLHRPSVPVRPRVTLKAMKAILGDVVHALRPAPSFCAWVQVPANAERLRAALEAAVAAHGARAQAAKPAIRLNTRAPRAARADRSSSRGTR